MGSKYDADRFRGSFSSNTFQLNNNLSTASSHKVSTSQRNALSIKGGERPTFADEEDNYDRVSDSNGNTPSYYSDQRNERPKPTFFVKDEPKTRMAKLTTVEIILLATLSSFVLVVLLISLFASLSRRRKRKRRLKDGDHVPECNFENFELDIEDPTFWGESRVLMTPDSDNKGTKKKEKEGDYGSKITKDYKMAAMEMMNARAKSLGRFEF